jgi:hypothetical protein
MLGRSVYPREPIRTRLDQMGGPGDALKPRSYPHRSTRMWPTRPQVLRESDSLTHRVSHDAQNDVKPAVAGTVFSPPNTLKYFNKVFSKLFGGRGGN